MNTQNDIRITFRVDKDLKERAEKLFDYLGLNMSSALNVFLRKSVEEAAIPFSISTKSTAFGNGCTPADITNAFETAVNAEIADRRREGAPVARYDTVTKQAYLEVADGTREYVNG